MYLQCLYLCFGFGFCSLVLAMYDRELEVIGIL